MTTGQTVHEQRQVGVGILLMTVAEVGFCLVMAFTTRAVVPFSAMAALFTVVWLLFYKLTVRVDREALTATFGVGLLARRILLSEVRGVAVVPVSRGLTGWVLLPRGRLLTLGGAEAVELTLDSGEVLLLGARRPRELMEVIARRCPAS